MDDGNRIIIPQWNCKILKALDVFTMRIHPVIFFYPGKLIQCKVTGIAHKRPRGEQLDEAHPVRDDETSLWQCPFCQKKDFPELSEVTHLHYSDLCYRNIRSAIAYKNPYHQHQKMLKPKSIGVRLVVIAHSL